MSDSVELPATFGDYPTHKASDIAGCILGVAVFAILVFANGFILFKNTSKHHKFFGTRLLLTHAIARVATFAIRLAAAENPDQIGLEISASALTNAGVLLLLNLNTVFAQRVFTAAHPSLGRRGSPFSKFMAGLYVTVILLLVATIVTVSCVSSLDAHAAMQVLVFRKVATIFFTVFAAFPLVLTALSYWIQPSDTQWPSRYADWVKGYNGFYFPTNLDPGDAEFDEKIPVHVIPPTERGQRKVSAVFIVSSSTVLTAATAIRASSLFINTALAHKPWQDTKIAMYVCVLAVEAFVSLMFTFGRVDLKFYIPDKKARRAQRFDIVQGDQIDVGLQEHAYGTSQPSMAAMNTGRTHEQDDDDTSTGNDALKYFPIARMVYKMVKSK